MLSQAPILLMTRAAETSERFAQDIEGVEVIVSPLQRIEILQDKFSLGGIDGLVFTSENGVRAFAVVSGRRDLPSFAVGPRTAQAAREIGLTVMSADGAARDLVDLLGRKAQGQTLLYVRGQHVAHDLAKEAAPRGVLISDHVGYVQHDEALTPAAEAALAGGRAVIIPLFSPRTARALCRTLPAKAPVFIAAISGAVAAEVKPENCRLMMVADAPNGEAMTRVTRALVKTCVRLESRGAAG